LLNVKLVNASRNQKVNRQLAPLHVVTLYASGLFVTLIHSYPRERYQKVLIDKISANDVISFRWKKVTNVVFQGSYLVPLLYYWY
jgi:hypothetical protein